MYRDNRWEKGMYADDLVKFHCGSCGDEFIAARSAVEKANTKGQRICCPYCSGRYLEEQVSTDGEDMEDLSDAMGCLAIYISKTLEKEKM